MDKHQIMMVCIILLGLASCIVLAGGIALCCLGKGFYGLFVCLSAGADLYQCYRLYKKEENK